MLIRNAPGRYQVMLPFGIATAMGAIERGKGRKWGMKIVNQTTLETILDLGNCDTLAEAEGEVYNTLWTEFKA